MVDALSVGEVPYRLYGGGGIVRDDDVGVAGGPQGVGPLGMPGGRDDPQPDEVGELNGGQAHRASGPGHREGVPRGDPQPVAQDAMAGAVGPQRDRRLFEVDVVGGRQEEPLAPHHVLGVGTRGLVTGDGNAGGQVPHRPR